MSRSIALLLCIAFASIPPAVSAPVPLPKPAKPAKPADLDKQILAALVKDRAFVSPNLTLRVERMEGAALKGVYVEVKGDNGIVATKFRAREAALIADQVGKVLFLHMRYGEREWVSAAGRCLGIFDTKSFELPWPLTGRER